MPEKTNYFHALTVLRNQLPTIDNWEQLHSLLTSSFLRILPSASVSLLPKQDSPDGEQLSAELANSSNPLEETAVFLPIPHTDYQLNVNSTAALNEDERSFAHMVASLLVSVPFMQWKQSDKQVGLLGLMNRLIADQQRFDKVIELLHEQFSAVFPFAAGRLLLLDEMGFQLLVEAVFGAPLDLWTGVDTVELSDEFEGVLQDKQTAVFSTDVHVQLVIPVVYEMQVHALLELVYLKTDSDIPTSDLATLNLLAGQIGIALNQKKLVDRAWQRANQLETIYRITESVRVLKPLEPTLVEIHKQLLTAFDAPTCYIALCDANAETIRFPCVWGNNQAISENPISMQDKGSLVAWVIENNVDFVTDDWAAEPKPVEGVIGDWDTRSIFMVPMRVGDEVLGVISIQHHIPNAFNVADYQTLTAVAAHVAIIIKNARLYTVARELVDKGSRDYQTAVALRQAIAAISTSLEENDVLSKLLIALERVVTYKNASVFTCKDGGFNHIVSRQFHAPPVLLRSETLEQSWKNTSLISKIIQTKEPICIRDINSVPDWPSFPGSDAVRTWLGTPLMAGEQLIGILIVESDKSDAFDTHEEWLVSSLAAHAAVAYQNARLFRQTEQQVAELSTLYEASATMTADLDQGFVLQTVATEMVRALQVDSCTIFVWDNVQEKLIQSAHESNLVQSMSSEKKIDALGIGLYRVENLEENEIFQQLFQEQEIISLHSDQPKSGDEKDLLVASGLNSLMLVPLVRRQKMLGLLALGRQDIHTYTPTHLRLARNLAGQATVALEHARLFAKEQRRVDELSTFNDIVLQLNTPLRLNAVLDTITESALKLTDATNLHIYLYDEETEEFSEGSALWRDGRRTSAVTKLRKDGAGLTATVVQEGKSIVINNASEHPFYQTKEAKVWGINAIAGFPLKHGDKVIGAFTITYLSAHSFTDDELLLLNLLAKQAAVAIKNAALFADTQRGLRDMSALVDMAKQVTGNLKLQSVLQTTVQILHKLLNARASTITMLSDKGNELIVTAAVGIDSKYTTARMELDETVSGKVVRSSNMVYIRDTRNDPDFLFFDKVVHSLLVVPLVMRDKVIGTITVDSDQANAFSDSDIQLLTIAAAQVGVAISNARLFEETEEAAAELKVAYDEVSESDRLKDELVQNVSHELRTPLTFVKGYVDLLLDGEMGLLDPAQGDALQIVADKTKDIERIIEDIITLQQIDSGTLKLNVESMAEMVQTAVLNYQMVASQKGLQIVSQLSSEKGFVNIDKSRINQVLDNLIGNAMKFSPDGGTITVAMVEDEDKVLVVTSDEGVGMPPEQHGRIFERFYQIDGTARRRFGGTGIGLALVKRIVAAHSGKIWVESELNKGSTFSFILPKAKITIRESVLEKS